MVENKILYTKPSITDLETEYAAAAAKNGWGDDCYKYINQFESLFKACKNGDLSVVKACIKKPI